ncbi:DUF2270 domain-containing protein [Granulosicoccus sp. 3-233]|uniref:DUF2270 domain-containing protein n=1 Tax=Granulosicoccus sp. 3-233 TaxID=3417969 RepID=UPI003D350245
MPGKTTEKAPLSTAEIGALAHLYRGEMYRSKIWRTRLDMTTNWAVVTTGIALSVTFSSREASPLPIVLVSLLLGVFLVFEGRRYRFFDIWRTRVRVFENHFYGPILRGKGVNTDNGWNEVMANDYETLHFHISLPEAMGRRLRRNYSWIFGIQAISYGGKLAIHPVPLASLDELWVRAAVGPIDGRLVLLAGAVWYLALITLALATLRGQKAVGRALAQEHRNGDRMRTLAK